MTNLVRAATAADSLLDNMVQIAGGSFLMGSDHHYREERPAHRVTVDGFWIDRYEVTNGEFARFVAATKYVTLAERTPSAAEYPGAKAELLVPGSVVFVRPGFQVDLSNPYAWWRYVRGANWRHPRGPHTGIGNLADHPVVHIAHEDALAYALWAGKDLPTEAEWEYAARGGLEGAEFAWGSELTPEGCHMANTWQGAFPYENLRDDGFEWTAPVGSFPANGYGLYDMIGNVWEWTKDWYEGHQKHAGCCSSPHARGGTQEGSLDPGMPEVRIPRKTIKGGSHLCAANYCRRYRPAARMAQPVDTSTCHVGFRCVVRSSK
jgi:formylglycine-generating enzyme required for sulfatase activity